MQNPIPPCQNVNEGVINVQQSSAIDVSALQESLFCLCVHENLLSPHLSPFSRHPPPRPRYHPQPSCCFYSVSLPQKLSLISIPVSISFTMYPLLRPSIPYTPPSQPESHKRSHPCPTAPPQRKACTLCTLPNSPSIAKGPPFFLR